MVEKNDWRLMNQMEYLHRRNLLHVSYEPYREGWDHDHCEFCAVTMTTETKEAYCTEDKYHWICPSCYEDFREMFEWSIL